MASKINICSMACTLLGANRVTDLDSPTTEEERLCVLFYDQCLKEVLEEHDWKFARDRSSTLASVTSPNDEYAYAYQLPTNCLVVRYVWNVDAEKRVTEEEYELHEQQLLTNLEDDISVVYTKLDEVTGKYPTYFVKALIYKLASYLAYKLAEKLKTAMDDGYDTALLKAIDRDQCQNNYPIDTNQDSWLAAGGFSEGSTTETDDDDWPV